MKASCLSPVVRALMRADRGKAKKTSRADRRVMPAEMIMVHRMAATSCPAIAPPIHWKMARDRAPSMKVMTPRPISNSPKTAAWWVSSVVMEMALKLVVL